LPDSAAEILLAEEAILRVPADVGGGGIAGACLHQLFEGRADAEPDATALVDGKTRISYQELERRANRLAHRLREMGAGPEVRVAVCQERTSELVATLLAILKTGAAYVPIDPAYPRERQAILLADSRPAILVTEDHLLGRVPEIAATVCVDRDRTELARRSDARLTATAVPGNLAYLIYTSGSTGRPKAIAIEHRSAMARLRWSARMFPRDELAGVLGSTSVCFDMSVFEVFATLALGGTLILAENALALPSLPAAGEVTLLNTVPSAAAELARGGGMPPSVRVVNLGGEPLRSVLVERLYALGHIEKIYNLYGPSEDTTYSTWALMRPGDPLPPAIGMPLDGTRGYLLDREMRQVGPGEEGELYLGGAGLSRGYLDRSDLTAERFVPNPFAESPGKRLYATGDLARLRSMGDLDYLGRIDHQVKIRGFRVELGEVEAALDRAPGVADAVVVARERESRADVVEKILVAYVVPAPGTSLDITALRAHLQASLTVAMVPAHFVVLPELPLSPNGKVDRKALPEPDLSAAPDSWVPPRTPLEETLAEIWTEVLDLPRVSVEDDFFLLGGHSLLATQMLSRVRRAFDSDLSLRDFFAVPTLSLLAERIAAGRPRGQESEIPALGPVPRDGRGLPLSFAQSRLWLLDRLEPGSPIYNEPQVLALSGALDRTALAAALGEIVRRHEVLRTRFAEMAGQPVQIVEPAAPYVLPLVDLTAIGRPRRLAAAERLAAEEAAAPFDLSRPPLLRALLLQLEKGEHHLLLTVHHIVTDGWSQSILLRELSVLYAAVAAGEPSPLPELPLQYADFADWQRRWLAGEELARQLAYWKERLAGVPDLLELPTDRPRPAARSLRGDSLQLDLPPDLTRSLTRLAQSEGTTLFMVLLAAFDALLFRYTSQEAFLVGSPIANRNREETEGLIGFFVNTLALRADLAGDPGFRELLRRIRQVTLEAYEHQDLPFEKLVEELRPERSLSYTPLFQVMLVVQNAPEEALRLPGIGVRSLPAGTRTAKFDLTLIFEERGGGLAGLLEFATDLFDRPTAARLIRHFETLLAGVAARPEAAAGALPLLTPAEIQQAVLEWNDCRAAYPREACVHDLVAEWAERTPDALAVVSAGASLSYRELDERAGLLARRLRAWGVGPDVRVAVILERSTGLVTALLAVLKAGGAFVPLDPDYPRERLAWLLEEARAPVVVAGRETLERLPDTSARTLRIEPGWEEAALAGAPAVDLESPRALPDNLAYVMFTSGTTGRPKGVAVPHRAVVRLVRHTNFARFDAGETLLLLAPASFDASTLEIWGALANGGRLVVYPSQRPTLEELGEVLERQRVSTLWLTAGLFHQMVERNLQGLRPVRQLLAGGDVLSARHVRAALEALPGCTVINGYGPTENTTFTCCYPAGDVAGVEESVPIGRPIANSRAVVVDRELRPLPVGVPGELLAGGAGLARGYLDRPDLTAERFIPDPTAGLLAPPGARAYRTGDLARLLPDGRLDFLGRVDQQVKIRGFRIEPAEIESALCSHPAVAAAVVTARAGRGDIQSDRRLAAYVVTRPGLPAPTAAALRALLRERLPEPMVPTVWTFLEELPLTAHGKVDRRALPEPGAVRTETALAVPCTPTAEVLAGLWCEVLDFEALGIHDNFFDLGGHSLLATQVVSRVRDAFGVELPLRRLFEAPTVGAFAEVIDEALRGEAGVRTPGVEPVRRGGPLPLSFAQRRLWFLDQLSPGSAVYNIPYPLSLEGELDPSILKSALEEVVRRHEVLRTTFRSLDGEPRQAIAPAGAFPLPIVDLQGLEEPQRRREATALVEWDAVRPFDLAAGPLLRATLLKLGPERHDLLLTMHHIVSDGWSMEILLRELAALYDAWAAGRPSPLAELPVQYADFAVWQRQWLSGGALARQLAYWRRQLAGAPAGLDLPADLPRPAVQTFTGATRSAELPAELSADLRAFCRREGVTLFMLLLAGLDVLLARYSGQQDVLVGSPVANRNRAETEGLIGFFVNTLVLRSDLSAAPSFRDLLRQVRETALAAYGHQDLPFELLVEELRPERDLSRSPFFQVLLAVATVRDLPVLDHLNLSRIEAETATAKFDLSLFAAEVDSTLQTLVEYNTDLYEGATVRRLLGHLGRLLGAAVEEPERGWRDLPLLSEGERQQLLVGFNDSGSTTGPELCLHELFEAQAASTPERVALVAPEGVRLTYRELNERAERLARRLRALGLGPEVLAGVLLERTADLIVALLAVLKAGGAYAPLDPSYPRQRVLLMLETARAAVLVTQRRLAEAFQNALPAGLATVHLEPGWEKEPETGAEAARRVLPDNLAYVIFTSGSTGVPKGVAIEHRTAVTMVRWARTLYTPEEYAGLLGSTSICFDMSVFEIFATLAEGGKILLAENALALPDLAGKEEVVLVDTVPSAMAELLRLGRLPPSIRTVNLGGEALKGSLVEEIYGKLPSVERVVNLYGPSEDTTFSTYSVVPRGAAQPRIGRPVAGEAAYVLDNEMRPVPVGIPGALYLGGEGVTRGYLYRPEPTAERYIPNPYGPPGSRLYRVGDLVRVLPAGELDFLGRLDHQVKVRGFRIELGEIESALARHPEVREAAVLAEPEPGGAGNRLIAYVEADDSSTRLAGELRAFLKQSLPDYMVPSRFVLLGELPLTPNGKIDRRALAAMPREAERAAAAGDGTPRSYAEEVLAGIWSEMFGQAVGVGDSFFDLGGHSLLATRVVSRVREAFGVELPVRRLFEQPTVAGLAASIEALLGTGGAAAAPRLEPVPRTGPLPLSFGQRRLWFLEQLSPGSPVYNVPFALSLEGGLDPRALANALTEVVRRHEALRTTFPSLDGEPYQAISPAGRFPMPVVDLQGLEEPLRGPEAAALAAAESARPFDLGRGPLFRTALLKLEPGRHLLLLAMHHIVSDGWSIEVLLRELAALYEAFVAGGPSPLSELPVQYADFAAWQRRWLSGEALSRQLAYWRRQLAGAPAGLDLPADFARPAVQTFNGAVRAAELPAALPAELEAFCRREGATLFMLLLAAFDVLLARYSGQPDVLVGSPVANRNRAEIEGLIGFFVNTLVLRADLGAAVSFRDVLRQVRETALAAYGHQDLPFETLVEELRPERDLSRSPFFQVMLAVQSRGLELPRMRDLRLSLREGEVETAKFDLSLFVTASPSSLSAAAEYNTALFEGTTIRRLLSHLERLLREAVSDPERGWRDLPLLAAAERAQLLAAFNDGGSTRGPDLCLHRLFEDQAARTPERVALVAPEGVSLTYRGLNERAERLARRLRRLGLGPETLAGVLLDRTADLVVALLAVLKAGGAYAPLDPAYPKQRLLLMLAMSRARVLVTRDRLADSLGDDLPAGLRTVRLEPGWDEEPETGPPAEPRAALPDNLAYVIFTSGSTGVPKGVAIAHRSAVAMVRWARTVFTPEEYAGMLASTSICFDMSVFEIFAALAEGGRILLAKNALSLPDLAAREEVVLVDTVPSAMAELLRLGGLPPSIRTVNLGGEALNGSLVEEIYAQLPGVERVVNLYGPSEDTTFSTYAVVPRGAETPRIGRPVSGEAAYVLDPEMRPVPVGIAGALYLGGEGVSRGYLHRPELTAERYVPNPYGPPGSRLYRVGDLARVLPTGELDFLGRLDHQVKVRGFRIELGEIEAALARHPELREAAVLALPEPDGTGTRLTAYVVPGGEAAPMPDTLRTFLKRSLPEYMIPSAFLVLPELPLTPNGKIDRRRLAALPVAAEVAAAGKRGPRSYAEEVLAGIWSEVFGQPVGVDDDFFDLGGHSLLATRVVSRLRSALNVELPLQQIFAAPTVEGLAAWIEREIEVRRGVPLPPIERAPRDGELPLSFAQQRLWFLDRLEPGTATFNLPAPLRLAGPLDVAALAGALAGIVERHESLRTVFAEREGKARQIVLPAMPSSLSVADLGGLPVESREAEARRLVDEEARLPFDLTRGPLLRTALLRLAPDEHLLLVTMHHIVTDGWSTSVFARELAALYDAAVTGRPSALPELPFQYPDFALWQRRALDGEAVSALLARWQERLGTDLPVLRLPTDRPRPAVQTTPGGYRYAVLPPDLTQDIRGLARASGTTLFMTLLAAFQALLARYTGQEKIVVGSPVAGRDRGELEGLIGFFVNTLVLPADLSGDPTFAQLLERVRDMILAAYTCQDLPFEKLVEHLQPQRDRSRSPLFQVMFLLQNASETAGGTSAGLTLSPLPATNGASAFDLTLAITETPERLWAVIEYNTDLFDAATIERLLEHYRRLLAAAAADPDARISALPPAVEELPRPTPEPVLTIAAQKPDADARRDRLAARMSKLTQAQREALERRLRGGSAV
jgi:amino acid adenylation domain-containing protein